MITLPGLIDPHVHLRTPGQSEKEDFTSGTKAALAGGFTTVLDMPNNSIPITTRALLKEKQALAKQQIVCDTGFYFGSLGENLDEFVNVQDGVMGIKIYLNQTTGNYRVDGRTFAEICERWSRNLPILLHAEEDVLEEMIEIGHQAGQKLHICHVSSQKELEAVITAKQKGYLITCGVTPHHLFLNAEQGVDLGPFGTMKPVLRPQEDVTFLWDHLADIDVIESDHAPHTREEKQNENPPYGVPGLETTLGLLLTAVSQNKLTVADIIRLCHEVPAKIFAIPTDPETRVEIDENEKWTVKNNELFTKCQWSPFDGQELIGRVKRVYIRNTKVFEDGKIIATPGFGKVLKDITNS